MRDSTGSIFRAFPFLGQFTPKDRRGFPFRLSRSAYPFYLKNWGSSVTHYLPFFRSGDTLKIKVRSNEYE